MIWWRNPLSLLSYPCVGMKRIADNAMGLWKKKEGNADTWSPESSASCWLSTTVCQALSLLVLLIHSVTLEATHAFYEQGSQVTAETWGRWIPGGLHDGNFSPDPHARGRHGHSRTGPRVSVGRDCGKSSGSFPPRLGLFQEWANTWCQLQWVPMDLDQICSLWPLGTGATRLTSYAR